MKLQHLFIVLALLWVATLTPPGYKIVQKVVNNPLHNQIFCSFFSVLDQHESTKPDLSSWKIYLDKCMIQDKIEMQKIDEFLEKNKEKLKETTKKIEFKIDEKK